MSEAERAPDVRTQLGVSDEDVMKAVEVFHSPHYLRHNARRFEHLATLGLDLAGKSVLEIGAGIGDHTTLFLDRGCRVVAVEPRPENNAAFIEAMQWLKSQGYAAVKNCTLMRTGIEGLDGLVDGRFDIVYCYGLLYHVADPAAAIGALARRCGGLMLIETVVSLGGGAAVNPVAEPKDSPSQAFGGVGCRPTRRWIVDELKRHFGHVYLPLTQPWHEEFPIDWSVTRPPAPTGFARAIFIASNQPLASPVLSDEIPMTQRRC